MNFLPQIKTYPAGLRQNMVRLRAPSGDDLIAHFFRERDIHHVVAVDMPDLAPADHILHAAKAMRCRSHAIPFGHCFCDDRLRTFDTHSDSCPLPSFLHNSPSVVCSLADKTLNSSTNAAM